MGSLKVGALLRNWLCHDDRAKRVERSAGRPFSRAPLELRLWPVAAILCAAAAFLPATASAAQTRVALPFSPITGAGSGLTIGTPGGIAVDETSTNVFLNDGTSKTDILGAENGAPAGLLSPFQITGLTFPSVTNGIAVDNSTSANKGTVYIVSGSGPPKVKLFRRGAISQQYEAAGELSDTASGATNVAGAVVDTHGNLWVGDFGSQSVVKFNPAGTLEKTYKLSTSIVRPESVAVDSAGDLFVARPSNGQVYKYPASITGEINPETFVEVLPKNSGATGIAIDPTRGALFVALKDHVAEYDTGTLAKKMEFGLGKLGTTTRLAVNATKNWVYVSDNGTGKKNVAVFGTPVPLPTVIATPATAITGTKATLNGSVNPEGVAVTECKFEWGLTASYGNTAACEGSIPVDSSKHFVSAGISGLTANGTTYHYRLVAKNENGTENSNDQTLVTAATVTTEGATSLSPTTATLHGTVRPEGSQYTECKFEYGLTTSPTLNQEATCNPTGPLIEPDFSPHAVSASVGSLQPNATYRVRLKASNAGAGTVYGQILTFSTSGPPQITEVRALNAEQSSAAVEAKVDPSGFATNYRFEWGPTTAYGNRIPAGGFEPSLGSGNQPVLVTAALSGLAPGTTYHYRVVAVSSAGTVVSPDHELETLNSCGLPDHRCFELVSPSALGPVAIPAGRLGAGEEIGFQDSPEPGSLAYVISAGLPDATRGDQVLYHARRSSSGWTSSQLSPPITARDETKEGISNSAKTLGLSQNLECGIVESSQPLTSDPSARLVVEAGGANLYRHNADGSYSVITSLPPENLEAVKGAVGFEYTLDGSSSDCGKVAFFSRYRYAGVPGLDNQEGHPLGNQVQGRFYEWSNGALRSVGFVPGPGGETPVETLPGTLNNHLNIVSADGSKIFFSAERLASSNSLEIGKVGVFVRENGTSTRDLSKSETATPDLGATYQYATEDGSKVFFLANAGLTANTSSAGKDLYEYDLTAGHLTDLSIDHDSGGAEVIGFIGSSQDGSHVYFAARGQLSPGRGPTLAENVAAKTYSVYSEVAGMSSFVGTVTEDEVAKRGATVEIPTENTIRSSRVSRTGRYLLFQTSANVTGYESGGVAEAYLFDANAPTEATICVSCRQDGKPSVTPTGNPPLGGGRTTNNFLSQPATLAVQGGQPVVFFTSFDRLASGASEAKDESSNLYEWKHDQVFRITTEPSGLRALESSALQGLNIAFLGSSNEAADLYLATPATLVPWEDGDQRNSVYDARVGGGFSQPSANRPCDPLLAEGPGSCPGAPAPPPPAAPNAGSNTFNGPGNPKQKKPNKNQKKKKKSKKHHKKHKSKSKQKKQQGKAQKRHANGHRRAGQ